MSNQEQFKKGIDKNEDKLSATSKSESWHAIRQRWLEVLLNGTGFKHILSFIGLSLLFLLLSFCEPVQEQRKEYLKIIFGG